MANWTNIPTDRIEPGKPIRAIDGLALRDNPIAIAQGAAGAPKITENAMNVNSIHGNRLRTNSVTNDRLVNNTITSAKLAEGNSERDWVGRRIAAMGAITIGTYAFVVPKYNAPRGSYLLGDIVSGSNLATSNTSGDGATSAGTGGLPGTWRVMSSSIRRATNTSPLSGYDAGIALRIS